MFSRGLKVISTQFACNVWLFAVAGFENVSVTVTKLTSEGKTLYLDFTQPLQIAFVVARARPWPNVRL